MTSLGNPVSGNKSPVFALQRELPTHGSNLDNIQSEMRRRLSQPPWTNPDLMQNDSVQRQTPTDYMDRSPNTFTHAPVQQSMEDVTLRGFYSPRPDQQLNITRPSSGIRQNADILGTANDSIRQNTRTPAVPSQRVRMALPPAYHQRMAAQNFENRQNAGMRVLPVNFGENVRMQSPPPLYENTYSFYNTRVPTDVRHRVRYPVSSDERRQTFQRNSGSFLPDPSLRYRLQPSLGGPVSQTSYMPSPNHPMGNAGQASSHSLMSLERLVRDRGNLVENTMLQNYPRDMMSSTGINMHSLMSHDNISGSHLYNGMLNTGSDFLHNQHFDARTAGPSAFVDNFRTDQRCVSSSEFNDDRSIIGKWYKLPTDDATSAEESTNTEDAVQTASPDNLHGNNPSSKQLNKTTHNTRKKSLNSILDLMEKSRDASRSTISPIQNVLSNTSEVCREGEVENETASNGNGNHDARARMSLSSNQNCNESNTLEDVRRFEGSEINTHCDRFVRGREVESGTISDGNLNFNVREHTFEHSNQNCNVSNRNMEDVSRSGKGCDKYVSGDKVSANSDTLMHDGSANAIKKRGRKKKGTYVVEKSKQRKQKSSTDRFVTPITIKMKFFSDKKNGTGKRSSSTMCPTSLFSESESSAQTGDRNNNTLNAAHCDRTEKPTMHQAQEMFDLNESQENDIDVTILLEDPGNISETSDKNCLHGDNSEFEYINDVEADVSHETDNGVAIEFNPLHAVMDKGFVGLRGKSPSAVEMEINEHQKDSKSTGKSDDEVESDGKEASNNPPVVGDKPNVQLVQEGPDKSSVSGEHNNASSKISETPVRENKTPSSDTEMFDIESETPIAESGMPAAEHGTAITEMTSTVALEVTQSSADKMPSFPSTQSKGETPPSMNDELDACGELQGPETTKKALDAKLINSHIGSRKTPIVLLEKLDCNVLSKKVSSSDTGGSKDTTKIGISKNIRKKNSVEEEKENKADSVEEKEPQNTDGVDKPKEKTSNRKKFSVPVVKPVTNKWKKMFDIRVPKISSGLSFGRQKTVKGKKRGVAETYESEDMIRLDVNSDVIGDEVSNHINLQKELDDVGDVNTRIDGCGNSETEKDQSQHLPLESEKLDFVSSMSKSGRKRHMSNVEVTQSSKRQRNKRGQFLSDEEVEKSMADNNSDSNISSRNISATNIEVDTNSSEMEISFSSVETCSASGDTSATEMSDRTENGRNNDDTSKSCNDLMEILSSMDQQFIVEFHGKSLICVNVNSGKYVIMKELLHKCFSSLNPGKKKGSITQQYRQVYVAKERDLKIPYKELPQANKRKLESYLIQQGVLGNKHINHIGIVSLSDALRLYHFFFGVKSCSKQKCLRKIPSDADAGSLFQFLNVNDAALEKQKISHSVSSELGERFRKRRKSGKTLEKMPLAENKNQRKVGANLLGLKSIWNRASTCNSRGSESESDSVIIVEDELPSDSDETIPYTGSDHEGNDHSCSESRGSHRDDKGLPSRQSKVPWGFSAEKKDTVLKGGIAELHSKIFRFIVRSDGKYFTLKDILMHFDESSVVECINRLRLKCQMCSEMEASFFTKLEPNLPVINMKDVIIEESVLKDSAELKWKDKNVDCASDTSPFSERDNLTASSPLAKGVGGNCLQRTPGDQTDDRCENDSLALSPSLASQEKRSILKTSALPPLAKGVGGNCLQRTPRKQAHDECENDLSALSPLLASQEKRYIFKTSALPDTHANQEVCETSVNRKRSTNILSDSYGDELGPEEEENIINILNGMINSEKDVSYSSKAGGQPEDGNMMDFRNFFSACQTSFGESQTLITKAFLAIWRQNMGLKKQIADMKKELEDFSIRYDILESTQKKYEDMVEQLTIMRDYCLQTHHHGN